MTLGALAAAGKGTTAGGMPEQARPSAARPPPSRRSKPPRRLAAILSQLSPAAAADDDPNPTSPPASSGRPKGWAEGLPPLQFDVAVPRFAVAEGAAARDHLAAEGFVSCPLIPQPHSQALPPAPFAT